MIAHAFEQRTDPLLDRTFGGTLYADVREIVAQAPVQLTWRVIEGIGGEHGSGPCSSRCGVPVRRRGW